MKNLQRSLVDFFSQTDTKIINFSMGTETSYEKKDDGKDILFPGDKVI